MVSSPFGRRASARVARVVVRLKLRAPDSPAEPDSETARRVPPACAVDLSARSCCPTPPSEDRIREVAQIASAQVPPPLLRTSRISHSLELYVSELQRRGGRGS